MEVTKNDSSFSTSVQAAWDNHFVAVGSQNLDQILLDYTDQSMVTWYNMRAGQELVYKGLLEIKACYEEIFRVLSTNLTIMLNPPVVMVKADEEEEVGRVFYAWKCPSSGIEMAANTYLFNKCGKIARQTVVLWSTIDVVLEEAGSSNTNTDRSDDHDGPVQNAWNNHLGAFGTKDTDNILLDYTDDSLITVLDLKTETISEFTGLDGAKELFTSLFGDLTDLSGLVAPSIQVVEQPGSVFVVWKCPTSGVVSGTDTCLFDKNAKIKYQTVVIEKM